MGKMALSLCVCLAFCSGHPAIFAKSGPSSQSRAARSEIGLIYGVPNGFPWADVGAYVGAVGSGNFNAMPSWALKIQQGRFQHFSRADATQFAIFPHGRLKEYEAEQTSSGGAPIFVTATYQGKKRPVYFSWSLELHGQIPSSPSERWMQAVNVGSDRFITFWIDRYVREVLWQGRTVWPNHWVGLDNCVFLWNLYGVLDDEGKFIPGVRWDAPFPQNSVEFLNSIKHFFDEIARRAPEIKVMCNIGAMEDWNRFADIYANVPGLMAEDIYDPNPAAYARVERKRMWMAISLFGSQNRVALLRAEIDRDDMQQLQTAYMIYLLIKGQNSFWDPQFHSPTAASPAQYSWMRSALGSPESVMVIEKKSGPAGDYDLYSRRYTQGIVYVNWTGQSQHITLPSSSSYFDLDGRPVREIDLADLSGTFVTTRQGILQN